MRNPLTAFGCAVLTVLAAVVAVGVAWLVLSPMLHPIGAATDEGAPCGGLTGVVAILVILLGALLTAVGVVAVAMLRRFRW